MILAVWTVFTKVDLRSNDAFAGPDGRAREGHRVLCLRAQRNLLWPKPDGERAGFAGGYTPPHLRRAPACRLPAPVCAH